MTGPRGQTDHMFVPARPIGPGPASAMLLYLDNSGDVPFLKLAQRAKTWEIHFPADGHERIGLLQALAWSHPPYDNSVPARYIVLSYADPSDPFGPPTDPPGNLWQEIWEVLTPAGLPLLDPTNSFVVPVLRRRYSHVLRAYNFTSVPPGWNYYSMWHSAYFEEADDAAWLVSVGLSRVHVVQNGVVVRDEMTPSPDPSNITTPQYEILAGMARRGGTYLVITKPIFAADPVQFFDTMTSPATYPFFTAEEPTFVRSQDGFFFFSPSPVVTIVMSERGGNAWFVGQDGGNQPNKFWIQSSQGADLTSVPLPAGLDASTPAGPEIIQGNDTLVFYSRTAPYIRAYHVQGGAYILDPVVTASLEWPGQVPDPPFFVSPDTLFGGHWQVWRRPG